MLDEDTRTAIFALSSKGHGLRTIAKALGISRNTVKDVLASGSKAVPPRLRPTRLDGHLDRIVELHRDCGGNLVRVHEELCRLDDVLVSYQALTAFCRSHGVGVTVKLPAGSYHFAPGEEMQHDTSPHLVTIDGKKRRVQCASLVLCYSRRRYIQVYPRFTRFECKVFLTGGISSFEGAAARCMVDNTHVVVASGTGKNALFAPEMEAFAERLGFAFEAHAVGDANRSARVERPFYHVETNFYPGRTFKDFTDLNRQLLVWCQEHFERRQRRLGTSPRELFATEAAALRRLPLHVPDVYQIHQRQVDEQGFVTLHNNRYSAPWSMLGKVVGLREYADKIVLVDGLDTVATHPRHEPGAEKKSQLEEHRRPRGLTSRQARREPIPAETRLRAAGPRFADMVELLRKKVPGRAVRALHRLDTLRKDYPEEPVLAAIGDALHYGLVDMGHLERMILRRIAGDFFNLPTDDETHDE